ncbi:condensation domain-containing protein, partial [Streptosporangium sp. DT93]|uniref:condensation domain-containing protein n=1 Tax=Streptosporangium sp. DT93 TaxID=3393428 RepID=UPI003CF8B205
PFGLIVDALQPERVTGRNPLFQISLTLQPASSQADLTLGDAAAEPLAATNQFARFDVGMELMDAPDGLWVSVEYSTELFDADRIERLLDHYTAVLAA